MIGVSFSYKYIDQFMMRIPSNFVFNLHNQTNMNSSLFDKQFALNIFCEETNRLYPPNYDARLKNFSNMQPNSNKITLNSNNDNN
ncbi:unnamed protein product [Rhizophagus irregularis]|nr:unnamed protein product [Rhizophagus irregularis]